MGRSWRFAACLAATFAIAAGMTLGGGGAVAEAKCKRAGAEPGSVSPAKAERAVRCLLNKRRAARGRSKLRRDSKLDRASRKHSRHMVRSRCFAHVCPGQPDLSSRLKSVGYLAGLNGVLAWGYGENIAWGGGKLGSPRAIVRSWMRSEGHRRNILRRDFAEVGVGIVWRSPQGSTSYPAGTYTTDFGFRRG